MISELTGTISHLQAYANALAAQYPSMGDTLAVRRYNLDQLGRRSAGLRKTYFKNTVRTQGL